MFWIPIAGAAALLIGLIAHGSSKKAQTATDATGGATPGGTGPTPTPTPNTMAPPPGSAIPVDIAELVKSVIASGNVDLIRAAAAKIRDLYPQQAAQLDALVAQILAAQASGGATPAGGTAEPGGIAGKPPGGDILGPGGVQKPPTPATQTSNTAPPAPNMQAAIDLARAAAHAVGDELTVQDIDDILHGKIPQFPRPGSGQVKPQVVNPPLVPADLPGKAVAQQLALALKFAKKGTSSEPIALVRQFQAQEFLGQDGHYGSTVGITLADKYGIVPPQPPMYWGKKNDFASIAPDKANYRAVMMKHAQAEPQRRDEWTNAANQVK